MSSAETNFYFEQFPLLAALAKSSGNPLEQEAWDALGCLTSFKLTTSDTPPAPPSSKECCHDPLDGRFTMRLEFDKRAGYIGIMCSVCGHGLHAPVTDPSPPDECGECKEQSRLLGMSAEREAGLRAEIERLRAESDALREDAGNESHNAYMDGLEIGKRSAVETAEEPVAWWHSDFGNVELSRVQRPGWRPLYTRLAEKAPGGCMACGGYGYINTGTVVNGVAERVPCDCTAEKTPVAHSKSQQRRLQAQECPHRTACPYCTALKSKDAELAPSTVAAMGLFENCEHGIPRQFCTGMHAVPRPARRCKCNMADCLTCFPVSEEAQ